jgi:hypothetical protein
MMSCIPERRRLHRLADSAQPSSSAFRASPGQIAEEPHHAGADQPREPSTDAPKSFGVAPRRLPSFTATSPSLIAAMCRPDYASLENVHGQAHI